MRRLFSIYKVDSLIRTAIRAGDPEDPTWKQIMSGDPAPRSSGMPRRTEDGDDYDLQEDHLGIPTAQGRGDRFPSEMRDIYHFIITYSPPKVITRQLPMLLEEHGEATCLEAKQIGEDNDTIMVSVRPVDGDKETAFAAVARVMMEDLELSIENASE